MRIKYVLYILTLAVFIFSGCSKKIGVEEESSTTPSTSILGKPTVTTPISLNALTNGNLTISGFCKNGATVLLTGDDTQSAACTSYRYSFTVSKTLSGNYFLDVSQENSLGASAKVNVAWVLDNIAPAAVVITSPLSNPYISGNSSVNITGQCESNATVTISGSHTATTACSGGTFSFSNIAQNTDGNYNYYLTQNDLAQNFSSQVMFNWIRDTTIPPTPAITNFSDNPYYTNFSPLVVTGTCVVSNTVHISEAGTSVANTTCSASGTYTLNIPKGINGTYTLSVSQVDSVTSLESASYDFQWVYDTQIPNAPVITSPTQSPVTTSSMLVIRGSCENNATVNLTGDGSQSVVCVSSSFTFTVSQPVDGTYSYAIDQTDLAQNTSGLTMQNWIRDSFALPMVTIVTPAAEPFISSLAELVLSGECETGLTVVLQGVSSTDVVTPSNSLNLTCVDAAYSFTITKPDGTYNLSLYQTNGVSNSAQTAKTWTKDTVEPNTSLDSQPVATNYSLVSAFTFSSNEASVVFQCSLDGAVYSTCASPLNFSSLVNGAHTLNVRAVDQAGNVDSTPASYSWIQEAYKTIALYHFNSTAPLSDSGLYSGGVKNDLTDNSSGNVAGQFYEGRSLLSTSNYVTVADTLSQAAIGSYLTAEAFVKLSALPGAYAPIISKISGSLASFEYGIRKQGSRYYIYFRGSTNGTVYTEVKSVALSATEEADLTAGYSHIAVTWNLGSIKYYFNGVLKSTSSIGTVGSARLAGSTAPLRIGYNGTNTLNGSVDEARISQIVRWTNSFTAPSAEYTAD
ncbi:MAG: LamG domain-containing protein [Pseudobdellovibrio sp.]|nr:LamG domain-containing protein [Pseudobdellovibrio sp.]